MVLPRRYAAGFVLYREGPAGRLYLLLENARHGTWGFPKGHLKEGEDEMDGALRELEEETGIAEITRIDGFERVESYPVRKANGSEHEKVVTYFLARVETETIAISEEHREARWLALEPALETLQYDLLRDLIRDADAQAERADPLRRS